MNVKKLLKRLAVLAFFAAAGWFAYQQWLAPFQASHTVGVALVSDESVTVETEPFLTFSPTDRTPKAGFVIYPGARIPPEAYATIARQVADQGYLVVVPNMPFGWAFLAAAKANEVRQLHPDIPVWAIGGHSLGGVMAASFADQNSRMEGLVLMAAVPSESIDMSLRNIKVVVIYGSNDSFATVTEVEAAAKRLPELTEFVLIEGGNHSQFGSYGHQDGDGVATIALDEQQAVVVAEIVKLLRDID